MLIKYEKPPEEIYSRILEKFDTSFENGGIFTYGDTIYTKNELPDHLLEHEKVHIVQQANYEGGFIAWWNRYLEDTEFRTDQELEAYRVQYRYIKKNYERNKVAWLLHQICLSLSGQMYKLGITYNEANNLLRKNL